MPGTESQGLEWPAKRIRDTFIKFFEEKGHDSLQQTCLCDWCGTLYMEVCRLPELSVGTRNGSTQNPTISGSPPCAFLEPVLAGQPDPTRRWSNCTTFIFKRQPHPLRFLVLQSVFLSCPGVRLPPLPPLWRLSHLHRRSRLPRAGCLRPLRSSAYGGCESGKIGFR
ncbi:hypothetical protein ACFX13_033125 [Malus domestica]